MLRKLFCTIGAVCMFTFIHAAEFRFTPKPETLKKALEAYHLTLKDDGNGKKCLFIGTTGKGGKYHTVLNPAEFAGKEITAKCRFKISGVSYRADRENTHGFVMLVTSVSKSKGPVWNSIKPVTGTTGWQTAELKLSMPEDLKSLSFSVSIPDGTALVSDLTLASVEVSAAEKDAPKMIQTLSPLAKIPQIDGKFSIQEWENCSIDNNLIANFNNKRSQRRNPVFYGYDSKNFYFCSLSDAPADPQKLDKNDSITLTLKNPAGKSYSCSFFADGRNTLPKNAVVKTSTIHFKRSSLDPNGVVRDGKKWLIECAVPWSAFGQNGAPDKSTWEMQVFRKWFNPAESSYLAYPQDSIKLIFDASHLAVSGCFDGHGEGVTVNIVVHNNSAAAKKVNVDALITSIEVPHRINQQITIPANGKNALRQYIMVGAAIDRNMDLKVTDTASGKILYHRNINWNVSNGRMFVNPDPPTTMNFGYSPTQKRIIARVLGKDSKLADVKKIQFRLIGEDGATLNDVTGIRKSGGYYYADWQCGELNPGKYTVSAVIIRNNGKEETLSKSFTKHKFEWENTNVGEERFVPAPFKPLTRKNNEVHALQTGYRINGVFFDAVFALGENILAAPVTLNFNGKKFTTVSDKFVETSPDLVVRESIHSAPGLKLKLRQEIEFDGMCKNIMRFEPESGTVLSSLYIDIPLKAEVAKYFHHTGFGIRSNVSEKIKDQDGKVWTMPWDPPKYPGYIWFGELYKGFCFFNDINPITYDAGNNFNTHELIRSKSGNSVTLRIHLAPEGIKQKMKAFEYVCGVEPTPVKPRPKGFRQYYGGTLTKVQPNAYGRQCIGGGKYFFADYSLSASPYTPYNNDYSWLDFIFSKNFNNATRQQIIDRIADLLKRNDMTDQKWQKLFPSSDSDATTLSARLRQFAIFSQNKYNILYLNPRAGFRSWKESDTYSDEWMGFGFRYIDDNLYNRCPTDSYTDMLLYHTQKFLKRYPQCPGLYYDNLYPAKGHNPFMGAREISNCRYTYAGDIFYLRELVKRTLKLVAKEKRYLPSDPGVPFLMTHMTDANIVPVIGLSTLNLGWEMQFSRRDYQDRFSEAFHIVQSLGTQTGTIPENISLTSGSPQEREHQQRTMFATCFAFDMLNLGDPGSVEENIPLYFKTLSMVRGFGYGTDDVEHFPGYEMAKNPVKCTPASVRITTCKHKDGRIMLLVGNLGGAARVKLDLSAMPIRELKNAETGAAIINGEFDLAKHDFAILTGSWK